MFKKQTRARLQETQLEPETIAPGSIFSDLVPQDDGPTVVEEIYKVAAPVFTPSNWKISIVVDPAENRVYYASGPFFLSGEVTEHALKVCKITEITPNINAYQHAKFEQEMQNDLVKIADNTYFKESAKNITGAPEALSRYLLDVPESSPFSAFRKDLVLNKEGPPGIGITFTTGTQKSLEDLINAILVRYGNKSHEILVRGSGRETGRIVSVSLKNNSDTLIESLCNVLRFGFAYHGFKYEKKTANRTKDVGFEVGSHQYEEWEEHPITLEFTHETAKSSITLEHAVTITDAWCRQNGIMIPDTSTSNK